ncbi:MAG TPA: phospholipid-binding protein [Gammaproteobacteria bacterium]|nr:phospholipid-binding protein [Gammaproteobacteria bacterium]
MDLEGVAPFNARRMPSTIRLQLAQLRTIIEVTMRLSVALLVSLLLASGCTTMSSDPRARTPGTVIDDASLEWDVRRNIEKSDPGFERGNLTIVVYNGIMLLAGQVESDALKQLAEERATVPNIRAVHNEIEVMPPISMVARANDSWLTTKIKTQMFSDAELVAGKIKVVTVNNIVFLMGILPREEADRAVEIARGVYGVKKIVKVFEYL